MNRTTMSLAAAALAAALPLSASAAPSVSWVAPAEGGPLSGNVQGPPLCEVTGKNIAKVMFYLNGTWTNTDGNLSNGLGCWIDTTKYKNGSYTVKAVAYDKAGRTASASRTITISNPLPTVQWEAPAEGGKLSGNVQGPPNCVVTGTNIARVMFYINGTWTNTDGNLDNGLGCWIDTTKYADGPYTLSAVAYDAVGNASAAVKRGIVIANRVNAVPLVSIDAPAANATLSGTVSGSGCQASASDSDGAVAKVDFYLGATALGTQLAAPYQCAFDSKRFADGEHQLMAVATDNEGAAASAQRTVRIDNSTPPPPTTLPIDAADLLGEAQAEVAFSQQKGYTAQVIGTYTGASSIAESGIHGTVLNNGETLRLGKEIDPLDSTRGALAFQVAPEDPNTSGSKRSELSFHPMIEMDKVYWVALRAFVHDWGTLASSDSGLFGTQMHSGNNSLGLSPSFGIYTASNGRQFRIYTRYSTDATPSQSNTVIIRHGYHDIPFGRWVDFVFKFKHNLSGAGFLQAWADGVQIVDYAGNLGFNTPGYKDYAKFGYYNWSTFDTRRKVLLKSPTIVLDPTGAKYQADDLRAHIRSK